MLTIKEKGLLFYIIKHCLRVEAKIEGVSKDAFLNNEDIKEIVCFNIFQIGELAKNFSSEFLLIHNKVPWKSIKGMRDIVGHGYGTVDMNRVWETATSDIKKLRTYCESIIEENE